jgi:predicted  nucleic acid-binding Zn-ribbon protein
MPSRIWRPALVLAALALLAFWREPTRAEAPPQSPDVLNALLTEVRGLRLAMEQMASAGPRVQLAMGRLQLQEQRVNTLVRQLEGVRREISDKQRQVADMRQGVEMLDTRLAGNPRETPEERKAMEQQLAAMKAEEPVVSADVQRLQGEEASLAQQLSTEQGRWSDINRSLEELERALARKP